MATFTIPQYRAFNKQRIRLLRKSEAKSESEASNYMVKTARRLAPFYTGETVRGIRRRKKGKEYQVTSRVTPKGKTGFRQNLWSNRTQPHDKPRMFWNSKRPTIYGDGTHRTSGVPGWWDIAARMTRKKFGKFALKNTRNALRGKV